MSATPGPPCAPVATVHEWFALLGVHLQLWVRLWRPRSLPPATLMLALQQAHARLSAEQLAGLLAIVLTDPETGRASAIDLLAQVHQHLRGRGLSREQRPLPLSEEPCFHSGSAPASQWAALWWDCLNGWPRSSELSNFAPFTPSL